jgi:hypothetical protein
VVDADLIPISYDLVYGDEWVRGPGSPDQRTIECLSFERGIATPFMRADNDGALLSSTLAIFDPLIGWARPIIR